MIVAAWMLGIISLIGFSAWARGMYRLSKEHRISVEKVDRTTRKTWKEASACGLSVNHAVVREKGVEASYGEAMSYAEIEDGMRRKDRGTLTFIQLFAGFFFGIIGLVSAIGSALVAFGNDDGWFMIGFCVFFTGLFGYIVFRQRLDAARNQPKDDKAA